MDSNVLVGLSGCPSDQVGSLLVLFAVAELHFNTDLGVEPFSALPIPHGGLIYHILMLRDCL